MSSDIQLKIGDQLEITGDSSGYLIGTILRVVRENGYSPYNPEIFITNAPNEMPWTVTWSINEFPNNFKLIGPPTIPQSQVPLCQCGKDRHGFTSHSQWCDKYSI